MRNKVNNKVKTQKKQYFRNKWEQAGTNVKKQWEFVNNFVKGKQTKLLIQSLKHGGHIVNDTFTIENLLNKHFTDTGEKIVKELKDLTPMLSDVPFGEVLCKDSMYVQLTNDIEISEIIAELKGNSAPGHDNVTVLYTINLRDDINSKKINQQSVIRGKFSEELKIIQISPIFKSVNKDCMINYTPISVISVLSNIIEKLI